VNNPRAARYLVVAQRVHADDLSGRLLADGGWSHLCLPLVAEKETIHEVAGRRWKRRVGSVLRPDAWSSEEVERRRRQVGPSFAAMYQQSPANWVAIEGTDFPLFEHRPHTPHGVVLSVDTAHSDKPGASFTVVQAWQPCRDHHLLLDQHRERVQPGRLELILGKFVRLYAPGQILIEYTGAGIGLATIAEKRYPGIVSRIVPNRSKIERFDQILVLIKSKRVKLPQYASWLSDFLDEVTCFPEADTDDQCDAMSAYLNWAADHGPLEPGQAQGIGLLAMVSPGRRLEFSRFRGRL
jgi:phage terminase large subunit-like protein